MIVAFLRWYERSYRLQLRVAAVVFVLQIVHLIWLTTDVVSVRLFETTPLLHARWTELLIVFVDHLEIPTLVMVSLIYLRALRQRYHFRDVLYLGLLNSQWLHIFWITDEFVIDVFSNSTTQLTFAFAWAAIILDYFELPVIYETLRRAFFRA